MLSTLLLATLNLYVVYARPSYISDKIGIDTSPAPPPELGPPGAANADRDPAHLKYDIIGIVGAYLIWLLGTLIFIVFVGRRLRRKNLALKNGPVKLVSMKPYSNSLPPSEMYPSPISPVKSPHISVKSPKSPESPNKFTSIKSWGRKSRKNNESIYSISTVTSGGFDEAHRAKAMEELTDLYAHVMAHDEAKEAQARGVSVVGQSPIDYYSPVSPQYPPEFAHLHQNNVLSHPMAPTPTNDRFPEDPHEAQISRASTNRSAMSSMTPVSIASEFPDRNNSARSPKRPRRISIKNQPISQPMGSTDLRDAHLYTDSIPLSPRLYTPGPPPLTPTQRRQQQQQQYQSYPPPPLPQKDHVDQTGEEISQSQSPARERRIPPALALRTAAYNNAAIAGGAQTSTKPAKALPFREVYGEHSLRSAPPTKTTFLERPDKATGGPRTGVIPQTPYSPYMPYTPMTPITPRRLLGKEELKRQKKESKMKVLNEDDLVVDDGEMWGKVR